MGITEKRKSKEEMLLTFKEMAQKYKNASITNIKRGKDERFQYVYAEIVSPTEGLLVSALLDYCVDRMVEMSKYWD